VVLYCGVAVVAVLAVLALRPELFLQQLGRDSTLTGRTQLWHASLEAIRHRPLLGYGYGGFWNGWSAPSTEVWLRNPWGPPNAHNGILDVALNLGAVGTALWLSSLYLFARRGYLWLRLGARPAHTWPLLLLLFVLVYNVTEATTLQNPFFWCLLVASEVIMGRGRGAADDRRVGAVA
jgi:exopolysaccharide production protein ExoQ